MSWRKATASNPSGNCVELRPMGAGHVAVRNSHQPEGPIVVFTRAEVSAFFAGVRGGEFDDMEVRDGHR